MIYKHSSGTLHIAKIIEKKGDLRDHFTGPFLEIIFMTYMNPKLFEETNIYLSLICNDHHGQVLIFKEIKTDQASSI